MGFMPVAPRAQGAELVRVWYLAISSYTVYLINVDACVTFRLIIFKCI